ncbi:RNA polymerase sigma factor [Faecalibacter rhinopitheci]|uniref:RNA polymerase sigma factor n=1 Tax=Faecalibacter rhinopitheci TaxID=2779678 RepID=UPI001D15EC6D|nr:sigma-70 family RNA polymerase sigma factor [Faecalibacter rhinopitheci]
MERDLHIIYLIQNNQIEEGFKILVSDYHQKVYWQVRRIVYIHEDADDVTQNVFMKIFQHLKDFRNESKLSSWIFRITYNESVNFIHKRSKYLNQSIEDYNLAKVDELENDPYFDGEATEILLQKAIARLPEKQRLIFNMKYFDDMKYSDISVILETSIGGLKANYHHAVKKIEQYISESH